MPADALIRLLYKDIPQNATHLHTGALVQKVASNRSRSWILLHATGLAAGCTFKLYFADCHLLDDATSYKFASKHTVERILAGGTQLLAP